VAKRRHALKAEPIDEAPGAEDPKNMVHVMNDCNEIGTIRDLAREARASIVTMLHHARTGHASADLSSIDLLSVLYGAILRGAAADPDRDRFILSKCHAAAALYSVLSLKGHFPSEELLTLGQPDSRLCTLVSTRAPGVELSTGALGHGLAFAVGAAIAANMEGSRRKIYVLTGDGELQEGSNWEAIMFASTRQLDNLTLVVDRNRSQKGKSTEDISALEPLADKFRAFGWAVAEVGGHDIGNLLAAFRSCPLLACRPSCILAETVKGKGVSFMEQRLEWHSRRLSDQDLKRALDEIRSGGND
jgi:transketolase